jgi:hypothetical protein
MSRTDKRSDQAPAMRNAATTARDNNGFESRCGFGSDILDPSRLIRRA